MNKQEVLLLLNKACLAYPNQMKLTKEMISLWCERLVNIPLERGLKNLNEHIDSDKFFPAIADIIKHDPEQFTDYAALREETKHRLAMLEHRVKLSPEKIAEIKRKADSGELDEKYKEDPWLGGAAQ